MTEQNEYFGRERLLAGDAMMDVLAATRVLVFGTGGVGSWCVEALARSAVGHITLVDSDTVAPSNINRQLPAAVSTIGLPKVDVLAARIADINPVATVEAVQGRYTPDTGADFDIESYDYVIDAIDSIQPKVTLAAWCIHNNVRIISSMGAGGRIDPAHVAYADISETAYDGLAREIRRRLRRDFGIYKGLPVVYSTEPPRRSALVMTDEIAYKARRTVRWHGFLRNLA